MSTAPGSYRPSRDVWGSFKELGARITVDTLVVVDPRVLRLHRSIPRALKSQRPHVVVEVTAGERAKTVRTLERVAQAALALPRSGNLVCIGGGTLGDLATVAAHLFKRGISLTHVPTTLLAAVDSSVGGKGAVHLSAGRAVIKNALGVFHYANEGWICPELFETLSPKQVREGMIEAFKMAVCLDAPLFRTYAEERPSIEALVRDARRLKEAVCARDPYEHDGYRRVLNFGHTFAHALETLSGFRLSHGDAVGLGILFALDVGRAVGVTSATVAKEVEQTFIRTAGILDRREAASWLRRATPAQLERILGADKKSDRAGELKMVLLEGVGAFRIAAVAPSVWKTLLPSWRKGERPA